MQTSLETKKRHAKRVVLLSMTGLVLVIMVMAYLRYLAPYRFWFPLPIGVGPAGPEVLPEAFESVWTDREVVLLGLGDSVTAGFGSSSGHSYFDRLVVNPDDEFADMQGINLNSVLPNLKARNLSVSGSDSIQHIREQVDTLERHPPDVFGIVVMTTGGNDLIHWYGRTSPKEGAMYGATMEQAKPWIENFGRRLNTMLDKIEAAFPGGCRIFLGNIYDPSDGVGNPEAAGMPPWSDLLAVHSAYNHVIAKTASERRGIVHLVDLHKTFLGHGVHCLQFWRPHYQRDDPRYWYFDNLEDPNDRGYDAIRRLFLLKIAETRDMIASPVKLDVE